MGSIPTAGLEGARTDELNALRGSKVTEVASSDTQHEEPGDELQKAIAFMQAALTTSNMHGACIVETFTCSKCAQQQRTIHAWSETLKCGACGHSNRSRVPRLPTEGEITADAMMEAIRLVRMTLPDVPQSARDFCLRQEGAIRTVATTLAVCEAQRLMDMVMDVARKLSGGHKA